MINISVDHNEKAMKRISNHTEHFRELSFAVRQYGAYGELISELCVWTGISRTRRSAHRYKGKAW